MSRTRNRVDPGDTNAALTPNRGVLNVGDDTLTAAAKQPVARSRQSGRIPFGSYMEPSLQRKFKATCVLDGIEMQDALEEAVLLWLEQRKAS